MVAAEGADVGAGEFVGLIYAPYRHWPTSDPSPAGPQMAQVDVNGARFGAIDHKPCHLATRSPRVKVVSNDMENSDMLAGLHAGLRSTGAVRSFTPDTVTDAQLYAVLDTARFAPSGTNLQGWRVIVAKDSAVRNQLLDMARVGLREYFAFNRLGLRPFGADETGQWPGVPEGHTLEEFRAQAASFPLLDELPDGAALMVVCVDLRVIANMDIDSDRQKVVAGGSIYPFVWSMLLAARSIGLGGVMTTFLLREQEAARKLLNIPDSFGIASMVFVGHPTHQNTKLKRNPVETFAWFDSFEGEPVAGPLAP
jgi:nitroreductase